MSRLVTTHELIATLRALRPHPEPAFAAELDARAAAGFPRVAGNRGLAASAAFASACGSTRGGACSCPPAASRWRSRCVVATAVVCGSEQRTDDAGSTARAVGHARRCSPAELGAASAPVAATPSRDPAARGSAPREPATARAAE